MKNVGVPILGRGLKRKEKIEFHLSDDEDEENPKKIKIQ
jgi:hypothetical protein